MHPDDKRRLVERAQRAFKKHKTFEQWKRLKEEARRKRVERRTSPARRQHPAEDEEDEAVADLTDEHVLNFLLEEIEPFVAR